MQLTTVGKEVFRGARKALELAEAGAGDPTVQQRLRQLKQVEALRKREAPWSEVQEVVGLSRASYYRWKGRLKEQGLTGLKPRSKRPQRLRGKVHWSPELLAQVEGLRKENPTWGRWPIWLSLRKAGYTLSERRVGRILAYLEGQGRIERVASFLARARRGKSQRRAPRPYAQRKPPGYEVKAPGDLVQIDTLSVNLGPGEEVKHFSAVELSTRLAWAAVRWRATAQTAAGFLRELVDRSPFPIRAVQVDGGSEFMAAFEEGCQALGIRLFVLPPRSPKLNGHVERIQRTFRDEFYTRPLPTTIGEIQAELEDYLAYYNGHRPHMALEGLAPLEFLAKLQAELVPQESQMC